MLNSYIKASSNWKYIQRNEKKQQMAENVNTTKVEIPKENWENELFADAEWEVQEERVKTERPEHGMEWAV